MRFLLFNAVVAAALIYLFSAGDRPGAEARQSVDAAMSRLAELSAEAVDRAERLRDADAPDAEADGRLADAPVPAQPEPAPPAAEPAAAVPAAPAARPDSAPPAAPVPAEPAETRIAATPPADPAPQAALEPLPVQHVAAVPTHRVPRPGETEPVPAAPTAGPIEISEPLMSAHDRRRELFSLAQEMELLYATRVSQ